MKHRHGFSGIRLGLALVVALMYGGLHYGLHSIFGDPTAFGAAAVMETGVGMTVFAFIGYLAAFLFT